MELRHRANYFASILILKRFNNVSNKKMNLELQDYFRRFWGIDVTADNLRDVKFPTFEEALGILEIAHSRGDFFKGYGGERSTCYARAGTTHTSYGCYSPDY